MSDNTPFDCSGWLCAAVVLFACYCSLPETLVYHQTRLLRAPIKPSRGVIEAEIDRAADAYGLKRAVLRALVRVESAFNPHALSPVGARGIAQIMPFNHKRCGLRDSNTLWDATSNLRCGAQILREELDLHGDLHKALTVYNCGRVQCADGQRYANKVISLSKLY